MTDPDPARVMGVEPALVRSERVSVAVEDVGTTPGSTNLDHWAAVALETLRGEGVNEGHLDIFFIDEDEMATLNAQHMGADGATDVLSFPLDAEVPEGAAALGSDGRHLGDIVVCLDVAARQAPAHAGSLDAELSLLIIHGVLHILGHDHAEPAETTIMQARERHHLSGLGFSHPVPEGAS